MIRVALSRALGSWQTPLWTTAVCYPLADRCWLKIDPTEMLLEPSP